MTEPRLQAVPGNAAGDQAETSSSFTTDGRGGQPPTQTGRSQKQRAEKALPTDRLSFDKQVEVLSAIAQFSGPHKKPVTAEDLSTAIGLKGLTGGLSNRFFYESGLIDRTGRGEYVATDALLGYHQHITYDPDDADGARANLRPAIKGSWYWAEVIEPMLHSGGLRQHMLLVALGKAAGATSHKPQLEMIISWLEWVGLVSRDGEMVYAVDHGAPTAAHTEDDEGVDDPEAGTNGADEVGVSPADARPATDGVDTAALISFSMSVRITADDAAKLTGEQLDSLLAFAEKLRG